MVIFLRKFCFVQKDFLGHKQILLIITSFCVLNWWDHVQIFQYLCIFHLYYLIFWAYKYQIIRFHCTNFKKQYLRIQNSWKRENSYPNKILALFYFIFSKYYIYEPPSWNLYFMPWDKSQMNILPQKLLPQILNFRFASEYRTWAYQNRNNVKIKVMRTNLSFISNFKVDEFRI